MKKPKRPDDTCITDDHWLSSARRCLSPNQNARPAGMPVSLVVVHGISLPPGEFGGPYIDALFTNSLDSSQHPYFHEIAGLKVSAHLLVRRDGQVVQYVPFDCRAWHAGMSCYGGQENCNDFSIGIELEGTDEIPYTERQYEALVMVLGLLEARYPGTRGHLAGHSDIAPGRKTDPGPSFDWSHLHALRGKEHSG
ncbi:MAG: 1,6-anhydro-N-acetylmuramyl-L-alanine amidase AmpD [Moraxellaceae bacterium]|nr:1,6-anhydro-N-acetylmuramyl-L-alanine amidase AmpD [Moraxellaceae bacterium]